MEGRPGIQESDRARENGVLGPESTATVGKKQLSDLS